jgi:hypothetical protein
VSRAARRGKVSALAVLLAFFLTFLGAMTDLNRVTSILNTIMAGSAAPTWPTNTHLRLMTANGSGTANGTEATSGNCPGYTAGGVAMGAWTAISGTTADITGPTAAISWTATGNWTAIAGAEVWDTATTPLRWFYGALSGGSVTVNNGNTLQFAANSVGLNGTSF